jgi:RNA polymerase sigma-70 factor (ECF subfamily)
MDRIRRAKEGRHKFTSSGVMYIVNTSSEALADSKAHELHLDIEALFRAHYGRVARIIARVVRDRARSEELAVEVFLKLWRNQKAQRENVQGWLYRVAVRAGLDELRRETRRGRYERMLQWVHPRTPAKTPEDIHSVNQKQDKVRSVLNVLEPRQAQFLLLRSQDFTYQEVASILKMNPASIGTLVSRAEESFRKEYIKRYGHE